MKTFYYFTRNARTGRLVTFTLSDRFYTKWEGVQFLRAFGYKLLYIVVVRLR